MMSHIKPYKHCKKCGALIVSGKLCEDCKPMTNADRIRAMTDEELVALLLWNVCTVCDGRGFGKCGDDKHCRKHVLKWLKQEVDEGD